jgi:choline dehydrogenase
VTRVTFDGVCATGVEYLAQGQTQRAFASHEVILSAGAVSSPHLLMLSGVGPAHILRAHGIAIVCDRQRVGENLQEHPGAWLTFHVGIPTLNDESSLIKQAIHGLNWLVFGRGPATTAGAQAVAFLRSDPSIEQPDIQLHFMPIGYRFTANKVFLDEQSTVTTLVNVCRPLSRGKVVLRSSDPFSSPSISMPLLDHPNDLTVLRAGCRMARDIMAQPAIAHLISDESRPGSAVQSDGEWDAYLRESATPCYHPVGTCRMGSDAMSVVDCELRVRGVERLSVADASVMPSIPSGNTNAAAIMIGERAADLIRDRQTSLLRKVK